MTKELSGRTVDIIGTSNTCYYFCDPTAGGEVQTCWLRGGGDG